MPAGRYLSFQNQFRSIPFLYTPGYQAEMLNLGVGQMDLASYLRLAMIFTRGQPSRLWLLKGI